MKIVVRSECLRPAKPQSCEIGLIGSDSVANQMLAERGGYDGCNKRKEC